MKLEDIEIGMRVTFDGGDSPEDADTGIVSGFRDGALYYGDIWVKWDSDGRELSISAEEIEPESTSTTQPSLANTKIDVQKYADTYGLTLEQAHQEIQPWLFEQGFKWRPYGPEVSEVGSTYMYINSDKYLTQSPQKDSYYFHFSNDNKEITLLRNVSVSLSIAHPEPSVEIDGKQYTKAQLLEALAKLEVK